MKLLSYEHIQQGEQLRDRADRAKSALYHLNYLGVDIPPHLHNSLLSIENELNEHCKEVVELVRKEIPDPIRVALGNLLAYGHYFPSLVLSNKGHKISVSFIRGWDSLRLVYNPISGKLYQDIFGINLDSSPSAQFNEQERNYIIHLVNFIPKYQEAEQ